MSATLDAQATAQPTCEETVPNPSLCKLSLPVAIRAINLRLLVSPIREGEMHDLFVKWNSSKTE
jgi:hypothetical protein